MQDWIDSLHPMLAFLLMSGVFLVAGTTGWYAANAATVRFRRNRPSDRRL